MYSSLHFDSQLNIQLNRIILGDWEEGMGKGQEGQFAD